MEDKKPKEDEKSADSRSLELNVYERIALLKFLPAKANYTEAIIAKDLGEKISLTQEEIKEYGVTSTAQMTLWNKKGAERKKFDFTDLELETLKKGFERLNREKAILTNPDFLELCAKIKEA